MNTKEQQDKEYRAQWIRDAARDFMIAHLSVGAETRPMVYYQGPEPYQLSEEGTGFVQKVPAGHSPPTVVAPDLLPAAWRHACSLWEKYEQERK